MAKGESDFAAEAELNLGEFEASASFMLRLAELASYQAVSSLQTEVELSLPEQTVLVAIMMNPDARQGSIADRLHIRWPNMTKLVARLEKKKLITRRVSAEDRRVVTLTATNEGVEVARGVRERLIAYDKRALSMLDESERAQLVALLRKVVGWPSPAVKS